MQTSQLIAKLRLQKPKSTTVHEIRNKTVIYHTLNEIENNKIHQVFGVILSILKDRIPTNNEATHTMFLLIDPSCRKKTALRDALPIHLFLKPNEKLPKQLQPGNVVRLENLLGQYHSSTWKMYGKVNRNNIVQFIYNEKDQIITPITSGLDYIFTNQDATIVKELHFWFYEAMFETDSYQSEDLLVCQVTRKVTFNLYCLVTEVVIGPDLDAVMLRVTDATSSRIETTSPNEPRVPKTSEKSYIIDIRVGHSLREEARQLKKGEFLYLQDVDACPSQKNFVDADGNICESNFMKFTLGGCQGILKLLPENWVCGEILRRFASRTPTTTLGEENTRLIATLIQNDARSEGRDLRQGCRRPSLL